MSVGLIPDIKMTFQIVRELSEADRNALERTLEIDDREVPGMTAMAQRQIIRTLLAVSRSEQLRELPGLVGSARAVSPAPVLVPRGQPERRHDQDAGPPGDR